MSASPDAGRNHDRNFLFGLLAINQGLIDGPTLADVLFACGQSVSLSVEQVLLERQVISPTDARRLESLMNQYVRASDGDWQTLLTDVLSCRETKLADRDHVGPIPASPDVDPHATEIGDTIAGDLSPVKAEQWRSQDDTARSNSDRFRYVKLLSRGGLGVVSVAVDRELNREVALKRIHPNKAFETAYRDKFLREAEITGHLEHPGIVPVYGLGTDNLGHLYYAMRLIRGDTLTSLIADFSAQHRQTPTAYRSADFLSLVDHFVAVCQTISYAHRRNVLHRDLKPDNVMVGAYGETLVVDWGLAKVIGQNDSAEDESIGFETPQVSAPMTATRVGAAMGTPAYASPELIGGRVSDVDCRSDVYGLGAILYEILTGRPPISASDVVSMRARASQGMVDDLRDVAPHAPKALAAICTKCLARERSDRYQTIRDLIDDIQRWKSDQSVTAAPDSASERLGRWFRHHRGIARSLLFASTAAAVVAIVAGKVLYDQKERYADLALENQQLAASESDQRQRVEAVRDMLVTTFRSPDPRYDGRTVLVSDLLEETGKRLRKDPPTDTRTAAEMYLAIGQSYTGMGQPKEAIPLLRKAADLFHDLAEQIRSDDTVDRVTDLIRSRIALAVALRDYGAFDESQRLLEQSLSEDGSLVDPVDREVLYQIAETRSQAGQSSVAEGAFRDLLGHLAESDPALQWERQRAREGLARTFLQQGKYAEAHQLFREIYDWRCAANHGGPLHPDTLKTAASLVVSLQKLERSAETIDLYASLLDAQRERLGEDHPETLMTQNDFGAALRQLGNLDEAEQLFDQTRQHLLHRLDSGNLKTLAVAVNLAESYEALGRYQDAMRWLESTIGQIERRYSSRHPLALTANHNLAYLYQSAGRYREAIAIGRSVLKRRLETLGEMHPDTLRSMVGLASALTDVNQQAEARDLLRAALQGFELIRESQQLEMLKTRLQLTALGGNRESQERELTLLEEMIPLLETVLGPKHPSTLAAINRRAVKLMALKDPEAAVEAVTSAYQRSLDKLGEKHPMTLIIAMNLATAHRETQHLEQARAMLETTVFEMREVFGIAHPHTLTATVHLVDVYRSIGEQMPGTQGKIWFEDAIGLLNNVVREYERSIGANQPQSLDARKQLGNLLAKLGDHQRAVAELQTAAAGQREWLSTGDLALVETLLMTAFSYLDLREFEQAIDVLIEARDRVVKNDPNGPDGQMVRDLQQSIRDSLAAAYHAIGNHAGMIELFENALSDDERTTPDSSMASWEGQVWVALAKAEQDDLTGSLSQLTKANEFAENQFPGTWREAWVKAVLAETLIRLERSFDAGPLLKASQDMLQQQIAAVPQNRRGLLQRVDHLMKSLHVPKSDAEVSPETPSTPGSQQ